MLNTLAMREPVPAAVRELIRERVQALEQLEILLLMRAEPSRPWRAAELASTLQLASVLVEAALAHLSHHGFLATQAGLCHYAPHVPKLRSAVDELARSYDEARPEVLALISADAVGSVRRRMRQRVKQG